jgi:hypothetical protein
MTGWPHCAVCGADCVIDYRPARHAPIPRATYSDAADNVDFCGPQHSLVYYQRKQYKKPLAPPAILV